MDDVDREADTKEPADIVDREGATVESDCPRDVDRDCETKEAVEELSPSRIAFQVLDVPGAKVGLLKGIPFSSPIKLGIGEHLVFGRAHGVGVFLNDETASGHHMKLSVQSSPGKSGTHFVVENVSKSDKPIFINDQPLYKGNGITVLLINDKLRIGQLEFSVRIMPGDSSVFYQVEFVKSAGIPQNLHSYQVNIPVRNGNPENMVVANHVGAVIMPNTSVIPGNLAATMNFPSFGNPSIFQQPMMPSMPYSHHGAPLFGAPVASQPYFGHQLSAHGQMGIQQHASNPGPMAPPLFQQQPAAYPGAYVENPYIAPLQQPVQVNQAFYQPHAPQPETNAPPLSPEEKREMFHHKQPSEHSEDGKSLSAEGEELRISIQETHLPKN